MQAIMNAKAGDPRRLRIIEAPLPELKSDQVLVQLKAASINTADVQTYKNFYQTGQVSWHTKLFDKLYVHGENKILGADGAGIVTAVGNAVQSFKVGDKIFGITDDYLHGSWAEYMAVSEKNLALKPKNLSFEEAAAIPTTAGTALAAIKKANLRVKQKVLINGASGGVGLFALQIAKAHDAYVTTIVSDYNFDLVKKFGADEVVDYKKVDITQQEGLKFDVIIGVNGYHSVRDYKKVLIPGDTYISVGGIRQTLEAGAFGGILTLGEKTKIGMTSLFALKNNWVQELADLVNRGKLHPYLDQVFSFNEIHSAVKYAATQHLKGKVVLTMNK
ncbi:MAG TPA: NADP-dependent oxidoreductase [Tetragenococcus sp.]|nr:NADP-dependent oxidoreductase [Tetragenococcus sp.]